MYNPTNPAKDVYRTADAILRMFNPNKGTKPVKNQQVYWLNLAL